jgi:hypothetical protein
LGKVRGFENPEPIEGLPGWTVWKEAQTEVYIVTHNLGLTNPGSQVELVAIPVDPEVRLEVFDIGANSFQLVAWKDVPGGPVPHATDILFVLIRYA